MKSATNRGQSAAGGTGSATTSIVEHPDRIEDQPHHEPVAPTRSAAERDTPEAPRGPPASAASVVTGALRTYWALGVPAFVGLLLRIWVVTVGHPECTPTQLALGPTNCYRLVGDAWYVRTQAHYLAKGHGFLNPTALTFGNVRPGAYHPPLFTTVLSTFDLVGLRSVAAHRLALSVVGVVSTILIGLVAWHLARPERARATGVVAASIAALCPLFWLNESLTMSESIYVPLVAAIIGAAYRLRNRPVAGRAVALGLVVGLAALTRAEALAYVAMVVPLLWGLTALGRRRLGLVLIVGLTAGALLLPWVAYNAGRFPNLTLFTTSSGDALVYRSCDDTFDGDRLGYYSMACDPKPNLSLIDESAQDVRSRDIAFDYLTSHAGRLPVVLAARFGRLVEVYKPGDNVRFSALLDNRGMTESRLALASFYALIGPAIYGAVCLRRRRLPLSPLVTPMLLVTGVALMTSPVVRYRIAGDLALVLLAAVGGVELGPRLVDAARRGRAGSGALALSAVLVFIPAQQPGPPGQSPAPAAEQPPPVTGGAMPTAPTNPWALLPVPQDGGPPPVGCELSDSLQRLLDAWDSRAARAPATNLKRFASPIVSDEIDTIVKSDGDLLRITATRRREILRDLSAFAHDRCNVFGT